MHSLLFLDGAQAPTEAKKNDNTEEEIKNTDTATPSRDEPTSSSDTDAAVEALYHNICPPQSAGRVFSSDLTAELSDTVLIMNGLSSLGARVAYILGENTDWDILSVTSAKDRSCGDELLWYRQDKLRESGIPSVFIDWSDSGAAGMLLKGRQPSHVIIIPPGVEGSGGSKYTLDSTMWSVALHDFVALLEAVKTVSPATRLTLVSVSKGVINELEVVPASGKHISLLEALVGAFELSLSTYHTLHHIPFSVLRLKGYYGPWTHGGLLNAEASASVPVGCFIDDVVKIVHSALSLNSKCIVLDYGSCEHGTTHQYALDKLGVDPMTSPDTGRTLTGEWRNEYLSKKRSKLILTLYFTGDGFHIAANRFKNLQWWLESVSSHGLEAVVLHNGLDSDFMARSMKQYSRLSFESTSFPYDFGRNSTCTQSMHAFAHYLEHRADIERVIIMDLDKTVKKDVFPSMEAMGDWLYSDIDIVPFRDLLLDTDSAMLTSSMVLGGSRHLVLATLNKMAVCLERNNGTTALKCVMDRQFVEHAFLGWPLSMAIGR